MVDGGNRNGTYSKPARWWIGTIPYSSEYGLSGRLGDPVIRYAVGQREVGGESGYEHWQVCVNFTRPVRLSAVVKIFGSGTHWEPTRSEAALSYCVKEDSAVPDTKFEYGKKPVQRGDERCWDEILACCKSGEFERIPADVYLRYYGNIQRIARDNLVPVAIERTVRVYWGATGTGKSRRAWSEAGLEAYPKDPRTKFWDGYAGHEHVVVDEFRGGIDIGHVLRWFDRYPVLVEVKGSAVVLKAKALWLTSNLDPRLWYKDCDPETVAALMRRLEVVYFPEIKSG